MNSQSVMLSYSAPLHSLVSLLSVYLCKPCGACSILLIRFPSILSSYLTCSHVHVGLSSLQKTNVGGHNGNVVHIILPCLLFLYLMITGSHKTDAVLGNRRCCSHKRSLSSRHPGAWQLSQVTSFYDFSVFLLCSAMSTIVR